MDNNNELNIMMMRQQQQQQQQQQMITFECLVSYDRRKDKNLIIKWHHDERNEPIYQWIPELNKRLIAPQYRAYIEPLLLNTSSALAHESAASTSASQSTTIANSTTSQQMLLLEAGFRLVRPAKELGGKYTCSAISSQNDDSKWKKMIVYTPPRSFKFSAVRANLSSLLADQRDRLLQLAQPPSGNSLVAQLPAAYRMRANLANQQQPIDYVNVGQLRARQLNADSMQTSDTSRLQPPSRLGLKLVCDIDQVFPVPEVSIYKQLNAVMDGATAHGDKLAKLDTRIERDQKSGLFNVQVTSVLDDDELHRAAHQKWRTSTTASSTSNTVGEQEIYFECLMALTNLELSKYADNKRRVSYRLGQETTVADHSSQSDADSSSSASSLFSFNKAATFSSGGGVELTKVSFLHLMICAATLLLCARHF